MFLGIDLGTSGVKAVILDEAGRVTSEASQVLSVSRPQSLWSEQAPQDWVRAAEAAILTLPAKARAGVKAIGLAGQMHGATLLGDDDQPLRPAILWNDGRAHAECAALETAEPALRRITGNPAMPGFTAPKLAWVKKHEPQTFAALRKVLLPKDYLRLVWTGDHATDVSDASGTLWLDTARRDWSEAALGATSLAREHMPALHESPAITGTLLASVAARLGLAPVPVIAGAGDQAAGAIGTGVIAPGHASLALGTSGVLFLVTDGFKPNPEAATHAFCHALPGAWHQMAVMLSAASAVDAAARMAGFATPAAAYAAAEAHATSDGVLFLPYLSGERTPHNDPHAKGAFFGLTGDTSPAALVHAALEGVAFAFADGRDALMAAGGTFSQASVTGGGARSLYWGKILSSVLGITLNYGRDAEAGPAEGAARLARLGLTGETAATVCAPPPIDKRIEPDRSLSASYAEKLPRWRALYTATKHILREGQ